MKIEQLSTLCPYVRFGHGRIHYEATNACGALDFHAYDLRDWTHDRHRTTDDDPYGGGQGRVMKCEPIFEAYDDISASGPAPYTVFLTPCGEPFDQGMATELSSQERVLFICGHYEGIDERVYTLADRCISLGDYVLTSGELASMVVIDAVVACSTAFWATKAAPSMRASTTDCSNIRSIRAPRAIAEWKFPRCFCQAIMQKLPHGEGLRPSSVRPACVPIC